MHRTSIGAVALALGASVASAQAPPTTGTFELRPFVGSYMPAGALVDEFKTAPTIGTQLAYELSSTVHVVGTVAWTDGRTKLAVSSDRVNLWQYDVGAEANLVRSLSETVLFRPFLGAGSGGRTADYRANDLGTTTCATGYGALGAELQRSAIALRVEARDYVVCHESPITGDRRTRTEGRVSFGLAFHFH